MSDKERLEEIKKLEEENKRLREALEFYADKEIYEPVLISEAQCIDGNWVEPASYEPPTIYFDKGETARKALEGKMEIIKKLIETEDSKKLKERSEIE